MPFIPALGQCDCRKLRSVVLELKVPQRGETPEQALEAAARQVRARRYAAELLAAGAAPVHELCAVFDGKRAWVRSVDQLLAPPV